MSGLKAPEGNSFKFKDTQPALEDGNHAARVVRVLDLGVQTVNKGDKYPPQTGHLIRVTYELPYEFMLDPEGNEIEEKPRWTDEEFFLRPLTSDLATSTARSKSIDPTGELKGDWTQYLSLPLSITLETKESKGRFYTKVKGSTPLRKKDIDKLPELKNDVLFFDLENPDLEVFKSLPTWIQARICQNNHFKGSKLYDLLEGVAVVYEKGKKDEKAPEAKEEVKEAPSDQSEGEDVPW